MIATLVRRQPKPGARAMLYVHGHNDYFFQRHVADFYAGLGIGFYALDLRKCGRSLLPHQTASIVDPCGSTIQKLMPRSG